MKNVRTLNDQTQKARERHELASKMHMNAIMSVEALRGRVGAITAEHDDAEKIHKQALAAGDTIILEIALTRVNCALEEAFLLEKRLKVLEEQRDKIAEFEQRTGLEFNAIGPLLGKCCFCGEAFQYIPDHTCWTESPGSDQSEKDNSSFDNDVPTWSRMAPTPTPAHVPMGPLPVSSTPDLSLTAAGFSQDDDAPTKIASSPKQKTTDPSIPTPTPIDNT